MRSKLIQKATRERLQDISEWVRDTPGWQSDPYLYDIHDGCQKALEALQVVVKKGSA